MTQIKRNTQSRRREITELVNNTGEVSVDFLAEHFDTSMVTIRKDLTELERNGLLLRRFGGAVSIPTEVRSEPPVEYNSHEKMARKAIVREAAALIRDHNRILIDSGSTTAGLIPQLEHKQGLVVMTNSLNVIDALRNLENEPTILMTGGTWDPHSESFQGKVAAEVLRSYDFDQLFIGADGIDIARGTTTYNEMVGLSREMAEVSREVIVLATADKLGRRIPNLELPWADIDILITDAELDDSWQRALEQQQVRWIHADPKQKR